MARSITLRLVAPAALAALVALLAGCGPGEPTTRTAPVVDACRLVPPADVERLLRAPVDPPQPIPGTTGECRYRETGGQSAVLVLTWRPRQLPDDERANFEANREFVYAPQTVSVGDDSYLGGAGFGLELHTLADGDYLILGVPSDVPERGVVDLMKKALSRR